MEKTMGKRVTGNSVNWDEIDFFESWEFDSPDEKGSGNKMQHDFMIGLDAARSFSNISYNINSGYRTESHNKKVGGVANSSHKKGLAADISYSNGHELMLILKGLFFAGFRRIGISRSFVHVDEDHDKSDLVWLYPVAKVMSIMSIFKKRKIEWDR